MQAQRLSFGAGRLWLRDSFKLYWKNPALLTSFSMMYLLLMLSANFLPSFLAFLIALILPTMAVIVANACRIADSGEKPSRENVLRGLPDRRVTLLKLGLINLFASFLLTLLLQAVLPDTADPAPGDMLALLFCVVFVMLPMLIAFWFAPVLVGWNSLPPFKAIFFSFIAGLRNWRAFLVYVALAVAMITLTRFVLAAMTVFSDALAQVFTVFALMILCPVLTSGFYISYRAIFSEQAESTDLE